MSALTPDQEMELCRLYRAGWKVAALQARYGIGRETVRRVRRSRGVPPRKIGRARSVVPQVGRQIYWRTRYWAQKEQRQQQ